MAGPRAALGDVLIVGGLGTAAGGFGEGVPVSIIGPELSFLPQGSGVTTHRTPNAVSGAKCGGVGAVQGSDPRVFPQCLAKGTWAASARPRGSMAWKRANPSMSHQQWEWLEELHFFVAVET